MEEEEQQENVDNVKKSKKKTTRFAVASNKGHIQRVTIDLAYFRLNIIL